MTQHIAQAGLIGLATLAAALIVAVLFAALVTAAKRWNPRGRPGSPQSPAGDPPTIRTLTAAPTPQQPTQPPALTGWAAVLHDHVCHCDAGGDVDGHGVDYQAIAGQLEAALPVELLTEKE